MFANDHLDKCLGIILNEYNSANSFNKSEISRLPASQVIEFIIDFRIE